MAAVARAAIVKGRFWLIAAVLALLFGVYQYHQNALAATTKRDAVVLADNGNQSNLAALQADLASFVHHHMGASGSVFLAGSYDRATAAAATSPTSSDGQLYAAAQAACVSHTSAVVQAQCVINYVNARITPQSVAQAPAVNKASYTTKYQAPVWTPDAAGLALAAAAAFGVVGLGLAAGRRL